MRPTRIPLIALISLLVVAGCEDAALTRLETRASRAVVEARAVLNNREAFRRELDAVAADRARLLAAFDANGRAELAALVEGEGGTAWSAPRRPVRFRVGDPGRVRALLGLNGDRRAVAIEALECKPTGCEGELIAIPRPEAKAIAPGPTVAELPARPLWPPSRRRWERAKASLEELAPLRAELGPLAEVRERLEELLLLRDAVDLPQRRSALVIQVVQDALDSGAAEVLASAFEYEDGYGARGIARGAGEGFTALLARQGKGSRDGDGFDVRVELPGTAAARRLVKAARGR